jgi:polysaccharide export outer membrane protein
MTCFSLLLGLLLTGAPQVQQTPPVQPAQAVRDYEIGPRDVLMITVFGEADMSRRYAVDSDGTIDFPLLGRFKAGRLTLRELEEALKERLQAEFLVDPQLSVEVAEFRSQTIFINGEVRQAGTYPIRGNTSLLEVLAMAGGTTPQASDEILVVHPKENRTTTGPVLPNDEEAAATQRVSLRSLQAGQLSENVSLSDGDTIFVPRAETIFVTGYVRSPGPYVTTREMTVLQAISLAGGLSERGSNRGIKILRLVNGKQEEIDVSLSDRVQPGDTIVVRQRYF